MNNPRTPIRKAIATAVQAMLGNTPVFLTRPDPLTMPEPPCVLIYAAQEDLDVIEGHINYPERYQRKLNVNIDIIIAGGGSPDPDTDLDRLGYLVECAFYNDPRLGELVDICRLSSVVPVTFSSDAGDRTFYCQRQQWVITYESDAHLSRRTDEFLEFYADIHDDEDLTKFLIGSHTTIRLK